MANRPVFLTVAMYIGSRSDHPILYLPDQDSMIGSPVDLSDATDVQDHASRGVRFADGDMQLAVTSFSAIENPASTEARRELRTARLNEKYTSVMIEAIQVLKEVAIKKLTSLRQAVKLASHGRPISYLRLYRLDEKDPSYQYLATVEELREICLPVLIARRRAVKAVASEVHRVGWKDKAGLAEHVYQALGQAKIWSDHHAKDEPKMRTSGWSRLKSRFRDDGKAQRYTNQIYEIYKELEDMNLFSDLSIFDEE